MTEPIDDGNPDQWPDPAASYDTVADAYADRFVHELDDKPHDRELLARLAASVETDVAHPVCDLGCGPGHIGAYLAEQGIDVLGVDLSSSMVHEARRRFPAMPFRQGDMTDLAIEDGALAGIVCFYALIHIPRPRVPVALAEMRRVVRPGGPVLLAVHGGAGSLHATEMAGRPVDLRATLFELDELASMLTHAGFDVVDAHERAPYANEHPTPRLYVWATVPGSES